VTSSQRSPGFGLTSSLVKRAFSSVSRDLSSSVMRSLAMPKLSNSRAASSASVDAVVDQPARAAGEHDARVREAPRKSAIAVMRSAASLSATSPRDRRHHGVERAAEADDAGRRAARGHPRAESALPAAG
jgi:hypothetical protein